MASLLLLLSTEHGESYIGQAVFLILYLHFPYLFCFLLNVYTDRGQDLEVGKDHVGKFTPLFVKVMLWFSAIISILAPVVYGSIIFLLLALLGVLVAAAYSTRKVRLKEKGMLGVVAASLARGLPILLFPLVA